ncbi:hypothetical protein [Faecalimicrobium dakarense]|uniref:hypothetical protein n=1 Tax=Faecalimicrobium dakarense TaxID=1301100 RepID=UPI0004B87042|nr:hypothetical protein [[Clostridium] dakarense]
MKAKKLLLYVIGIGLLGVNMIGCSKGQNNLSQLQNTYFEVVDKDINNNKVNSKELASNLKEFKLEKSIGALVLVDSEDEKDNTQKSYDTSNYSFKNDNEVFEVSYLDKNNKEKNLDKINSVSYSLNKENMNDIYLNVYYEKSGNETGNLNIGVYPESVKEQKQLVNTINGKKEISEIYEVYYKIAQSIEDDSKISLSDIENLLQSKNLKKSEDYKDENPDLSLYSYSKDGLNMNIVYNEKESKCQDISLEDNESYEVSLCYYKHSDYGIQLWKKNSSLKEQGKIVSKIVKQNGI